MFQKAKPQLEKLTNLDKSNGRSSKKRQRADDATPKSAATLLLEGLQDFDEEERQRSIRMIVEGLLTQKEKLTDGLLMLLTEQQQQAFEDKINGSNNHTEEDKDKFFL